MGGKSGVKENDLYSQQQQQQQQHQQQQQQQKRDGKPCCRRDERSLGPLQQLPKPPKSLTELQTQLPFVQLGGRWSPATCNAAIRVAIIVPYRYQVMF